MRKTALAIASLAFLLSGCASEDETQTTTPEPTSAPTTFDDHTPQTYNVVLAGSTFVNGTLTVRTGDTVTWTHEDGNTAHTVTADDDSFDSHANCFGAGGIGIPLSQACMVNGGSYEKMFDTEGTVGYHCKVHPSMTGTITVVGHEA